MRARGRFFFNWLSARKERTISGSTRLRDVVRALRIQRGVMFARNLRYPRTTEPALDEKSLASLGIAHPFLPAHFSKMSRWLPVCLPRSQVELPTPAGLRNAPTPGAQDRFSQHLEYETTTKV